MNLSVLILTMNEEDNLQGCLQSVSFADEVVVLDSGSTDSTVAIAEAAGAVVLHRSFDDYAKQRMFGLSYDFKNDWILMIDADERVTPDLQEEIRSVCSGTVGPVSLYRMRRRDHFMDHSLKHASGYPTWFGRLFRKGRVTVEREVNEEYYTDGEVGLLKNHLLHYPFNKGVKSWFERHNRYSSMEAVQLLDERRHRIPWSGFCSSDPMLRRRAFKQLAYRLPLRPMLTFWYLYLLRLGFVDGIPGYHYCVLRSMYEFMIDVKIEELRAGGSAGGAEITAGGRGDSR